MQFLSRLFVMRYSTLPPGELVVSATGEGLQNLPGPESPTLLKKKEDEAKLHDLNRGRGGIETIGLQIHPHESVAEFILFIKFLHPGFRLGQITGVDVAIKLDQHRVLNRLGEEIDDGLRKPPTGLT